MTGEYNHTLDSKGRVFIPAKLRDELGEVFYLTMSMDKCINAYSNEAWTELSSRASSLSFIQQRKLRPFFANATKCELDSQGRALIPGNLREYAELEKSVTIVGCNNHCELWNTSRWDSVSQTEYKPEYIASVMEELRI